MKVLLRAPLLTMSGYGIHSRQVFLWLSQREDIQLDVECLNWGRTPWLINENYEKGLIKKIMQHSRKLEPPYDVSIQLQLPDEWNPELGKINIGMSAVVETDRCNPKWIDACNRMDHVVVPSYFTKSVLKRSGILMTPVTVIPEWFNLDILTCPKNKLNLNIDTSFNFLIIAQLNSQNPEEDRKNIFNTLKWACEEFKDNQDVGIILKTNSGKGTSIDKTITKDLLRQMISVIGKKDFPKIHLMHGNMKSNEVAQLYTQTNIKALLSATRGEGYGLPLVDAAAAGMPIVATNWSGHLDFLGDNFLKVDYSLEEIKKGKVDNRIFFEGYKWACPKEQSFKAQIRKVYEDYDSLTTTSVILKKNTLEKFSNTSIINQYDNLFNSLIGK